MEGDEDPVLDGSGQDRCIPTVPEAFRGQMAQAAFTHRSDAGAVLRLHKKIFHDCEEAVFQHLAKAGFAALALALPHYCSPEEAEAICQAWPDPPRFQFRLP